MKRFLLSSIPTFFCLSIVAVAFGQITPAKMTSTTEPGSAMENRKPLEYSKKETSSPTGTKKTLPAPIKAPKAVEQHPTYLHPGILVYLNGKWEGSDHLLNLTPNIGVSVSIVKPDQETLDFTSNQIQAEVEKIFDEAGIKPETLAVEGKPPVPIFQIEIFIYPIDRGYSAYIEGRLFESVVLDRFKMDPNMAFQAITWEKQHLIVSPKGQFSDHLTKIVQDIATSFAERFETYERLKKTVD